MTDYRSPMKRVRDRRIEISELLKYYKEKLKDREIALSMIDACIEDVERCAT